MAKKILGKDFVLLVNGDPFACARDVSVSITTTTTDSVGCRGDAVGTGLIPTSSVPTGYGWSVTPNALLRIPETAGEVSTMVTIPQMQKLQLEGAKLTFGLTYDDPDSTYKAEYTGDVYITDSSLNAVLDGEATGDFTLTGSGALTITETVPA